MMALVAYDIVSNRRRARLRRYLKEFGLGTQKSVFECEIDRDRLVRLIAGAQPYLDPSEDSFRVYRICDHCRRAVAVSGQGIRLMPVDWAVV